MLFTMLVEVNEIRLNCSTCSCLHSGQLEKKRPQPENLTFKIKHKISSVPSFSPSLTPNYCDSNYQDLPTVFWKL